MLKLGQIGIKYLVKALLYILRNVFDWRNIRDPVEWIVRFLLGLGSKKSQSELIMKKLWKEQNP